MFIAESLPDLLTDRSHMMFEAVTGLGEAAIGFAVARIWVKIHDKRHHNHICKEDNDADV